MADANGSVHLKVKVAQEDGTEREVNMIEEATFATLVREELGKARGSNGYNYPPMNSLHEGYAVILEEVEEFWDICKLKPAKRDRAHLLKELVQISAMAQRTAEDLGLDLQESK